MRNRFDALADELFPKEEPAREKLDNSDLNNLLGAAALGPERTAFLIINGVPRWRADKVAIRSPRTVNSVPTFGGFLYEVAKDRNYAEVSFELRGSVTREQLRDAIEVALIIQSGVILPRAYRLCIETIVTVHYTSDRVVTEVTARAEEI